MKEKVLLVDDDDNMRASIKDVLDDEGFLTIEAVDGIDAVEKAKNVFPDVVLLDLNMPRMGGIDAMERLARMDADVPILVLTAYGDIPTAIEAIRLGAYDFMVKPPDFDKLIITIRRAVEKRRIEVEARNANRKTDMSLEELFGRSPSMKHVIEQIRQVSRADISVIIEGETGSGKSFVASAIHNLGRRAGGPFVCVDAGLFPEGLVESELFGHKRGAFTGAVGDRIGYFETARGGTIFLDELENISVQTQAKLLNVIEKKKIYPLGSSVPVDVDVRVLAATNRDIRACVRMREFREDLFFRLGEFVISVPPLRERSEDIPYFADRFIADACAELNTRRRELSAEALSKLIGYRWPGNLRELKNIMKRSVLLTDGDIVGVSTIEMLLRVEESAQARVPTGSFREAARNLEEQMIRQTLQGTGGNRTQAAKLLDMSYPNLVAKIREYGI